MVKKRRLVDEYRFPGFYPKANVQGIFKEPKARVIKLTRRQKKLSAERVEQVTEAFTIRRRGEFGTYRVGMPGFTWSFRYDEYCAGSAGR